ncbi:spd-5, partial [Pristionchus pacificus]
NLQMGDDSSWKYDSYEDHSDLSGMLASNRDSVSEEEQEIVHDDGKSVAGSESTLTGSESNATLVDNKENRTPFAGNTPASRLSSSTQINRKKDRTINVSAVMERNKELESTVYDLKMKIGVINKELPWIMVNGKDHIAQYIQFKNDNEDLRKQLAEQNTNLELLRRDNEQFVMEERDRMQQEHSDEMAHLRLQYERMCQEYDALREEVGQSNPSPRDFDRSMMSDGSSMWSDRSRQVGMFEMRIEGLEKDIKAANNALEVERNSATNARRELNELRRKMEEKEKEWDRRASIATLQETFHIGIPGSSRKELMEKIDEQFERIDSLENELKVKSENENKLAGLVKDQMKARKDLENELRMAREASISIMENKEVDEIMRELLELSAMNEELQEECRRRGAMKREKKKELEKESSLDEIKKELDTTVDICEQYQRMGDRLAPLQQRIVAMNKSVMGRRSFIEGLKGFEVSGLTPIRLGEGSYNGSGMGGTPGTPTGRGGQTRLLHSVLQRSVLNVSHVDILNCSMNTSQGIKNAKDKLVTMRDSCKRLFERLQSSYTLFDEIRLALGGEEHSELARQMENLRLDLEISVMDSGEAAKAMEVVENSLFELQSLLEVSMGGEGQGRESMFNLSNALGTVEKEEKEGKRDMTYSIEVIATGERQSASEERNQLESLIEEHRLLQIENDEMKKKNEEMVLLGVDQNEKIEELQKEREELYGEVEKRREKEERLLDENKEAVVEVDRCKNEMEDTVARMQDHIDRLDSEACESNRIREDELRVKDEKIWAMSRSIEEKEVEVRNIHGRIEEITKELNKMRDCERRVMEKEERKISRLEKESEAYREQLERTNDEYVKISEELEIGKKREEELEKRLNKFKFKAIEEEDKIRKANERDESSTQTSLTMEKLSRMEWSQKEMISDLNRLGNIIENSFLEKDGRVDDVQSCLGDVDVNRLVDIVTREKKKKDENMVILEKTKEELLKYIEEKEGVDSRESRESSSGEYGDGKIARKEVNEGKYKDPLRQLFYSLTSDANELVQMYKKEQMKIMNGGLSQNEYARLLVKMRTVRDQLNLRLSQSSQKSQSSQDMGDAKTILRLEFLMEENNKLKSRIMTLSNALRSNWSDEEKAKLLEKIEMEMSGISKTLKDIVGAKEDRRLPSSSSAMASSTRKI